MKPDVHQLRDLADIAWARYLSWSQRQARLSGTQLELEDQDVTAQVNEWRGIWHACELELIRVEAANG